MGLRAALFRLSSTAAAPFFAGLSPGYAGLYQLNVTIPEDLPKGVVDVRAAFNDSVSNVVQIVIQ